MTALDDKIEKLKHYCNFEYTYQSLMRIFGDSQELFLFKNIVVNQAIVTYLTLTAKEQKQHYKELLKTKDTRKSAAKEKKATEAAAESAESVVAAVLA